MGGQHRGYHCGGAAFALGAGDVYRGRFQMRVPQALQEQADATEVVPAMVGRLPGDALQVGEAHQLVQGLLVIHRHVCVWV